MQEDNTTQTDNTSMAQPVDPVAASPMPTTPVMTEAMTEAQEKNEFEANAKAFEDSIDTTPPTPEMQSPAMPTEEVATPASDTMPTPPVSEEPVMAAPTMETPAQMPTEEPAMQTDRAEVPKEEDPEHPSAV